MAFDQTTRGRLQKFVTDARELLSKEFARQLQNDYGMDPDTGAIDALEKLTHIDDTKLETARMLRDTFGHYSDSGSGGDPKDIINRIVREQAFTVLNRLCAVRMAEARNIIIQSTGDGYNSKGFQLYSRVAATALGDKGDAYRSYIYSIFDELAVDLAVLFDRFSPMGRLFPKESVLMELLSLINEPEMVPLWAEDETIGWIYQYFNSIEERKKMRAESQAPRNSRELAVRNQFFTPRYVVEFLTDNTLGRIWYEMTRGETALKDTCRYLVRRPNEIFLKKGESAPPQAETGEELSQEELIRQPVHIEYRPLKDPRIIRMLDPACGSMHFGLYAFDLFERIYLEAWDIEAGKGTGALEREKHQKPLTEIYSNKKDDLIKDIPRLIIENNIHGVDIDPRAVQIAGLSLWLRAQKNWNDQNLRYSSRPQIRKANIVCAEPMPGESDMLREFTSTLKPKILGSLVEHIFEKMKLAGEAGSLLKIEEEIQDAVEKAQDKYNAEVMEEKATEGFLPGVDMSRDNTLFDFAELPDRSSFWDTAEDKIITALKDYAERSETLTGSRHRLFAEDAAKGFAFIDICRKRYDVVLMNPPFGDASNMADSYIENRFSNWNKNILCAFIENYINVLNDKMLLGTVFDKTASIKTTYENFRRNVLFKESSIQTQINLGWGVLDDASVEVSSLITAKGKLKSLGLFFDLSNCSLNEKDINLLNTISEIKNSCKTNEYIFYCEPQYLLNLPNASIAFNFPIWLQKHFLKSPSLFHNGFSAFVGHSFKSERHFRLVWEIPLNETINFNKTKLSWLFNGGSFYPFYNVEREVVYYGNNGDAVKNDDAITFRSIHHQGKKGIGYGKRGDIIDAQILRPGHVFTVEGEFAPLENTDDSFYFAAFLSSSVFSYGINLYCGQHKYPGYVNKFPCPPSSTDDKNNIVNYAKKIWNIKKNWQLGDETDIVFIKPRIFNYENLIKLNNKIELILKLENESNNEINHSLIEIDKLFIKIYKISPFNTANVNKYISKRIIDKVWLDGPDMKHDKINTIIDEMFSYLIGCIFGYWNVLNVTQKKYDLTNENFFDFPIQRFAYGTLLYEGLPAKPKDMPESYPLRLTWSGIIVDDEGYKEDIVSRTREAMEVVWKDKAGDIEHEACEILGVKSLRDYFRNPNNFFAQHLKRYSKSRRQAPIYWPLSTASGSYTLWLYYHRLTDQTLYSCVNDFVDPKIKSTDETVEALRRKTGRGRLEETELEKLSSLASELKDLRAELLRIAKFWKPDLNDGVIITAAPLWDLFAFRPWKKVLKETWAKLEKGDYDWAHLACSIWPERVKIKCKTDKSLAIAHDLEQLYEEPKGGAKKKRAKKAVTEDLAIEETEGAE
jgi:hypothetical protein